MIKIFNSRFENSLRLLLLLNNLTEPMLLERLYIIDFLVVYGKDFGITEENLNGDNDFKYSEFQSRKAICKSALKELVLNGLVLPTSSKAGILYQITDVGMSYAEELKSEYALEYKNNTVKTMQHVGNCSNRILLEKINKLSAESIRGESCE